MIKSILYFSVFAAALLLWGTEVRAQNNPELDNLLLLAFESTDSSELYFEQALGLINSREDSAGYYYFKFFKNFDLPNWEEALAYAERAEPLLLEFKHYNRLKSTYAETARIWRFRGQYEISLEYLQKALQIAESMQDTSDISNHLSTISLVLHDFEHYETGIEYGKRAADILKNKETDYLADYMQANNAIAINFDDWSKPDSALFYHFKNAEYVFVSPDSIRYGFVFNNIGNTLLKQEQYSRAENYIQKSARLNLQRYTNTNELSAALYSLTVNYTNLGTIYFKTGRYEQAEQYFNKADYYARESGNIENIRVLLTEQGSFYKALGNFEKALVYQEELSALKDSVFNTERAKAIAEIEAKYQTERKERRIAEQQTLIIQKDLNMQRQNTLLFGSIGLAFLTAVIGYLLYNRQTLKNRQLLKEGELQKSLAQIETQNRLQEQRLRISRDLHDNIGAQLTFIISSIDNLKYRFKELPPAVNGRLNDVSRFTGNTINELRDTIWAMNKTGISFEDLQARISNFIEKARETTGGMQFCFEIDSRIGTELSFTSTQGMNIYRIIQEAVNNALKYARATTITVRVRKENQSFRIEIEDNGSGFNAEAAASGNGIPNMKKRAAELGAELIIQSAPGKGTLITFNPPAG